MASALLRTGVVNRPGQLQPSSPFFFVMSTVCHGRWDRGRPESMGSQVRLRHDGHPTALREERDRVGASFVVLLFLFLVLAGQRHA